MATTTGKRAIKLTHDPGNWEHWSSHIAHRTAPLEPWQLVPSRKRSLLRWGLPEHALSGETERLLARQEGWMDKFESKTATVIRWLEPWLSAVDGQRTDRNFAMECLGWAYLLPSLVGVLPAAPWNEACDTLLDIARATGGSDAADPAVEQLLAAELPLTLAYQFPELPSCRSLGAAGRERVKRGLKELLDGNGLPLAQHLDLVRPLLACWTRCLYLARGARELDPGRKARLRYEWFVRQSLQLSRQTGIPVLSDGALYKSGAELFEAALLLVDDRDERAIADQILPGRKALRAVSRRKTFFPESADHSEWARLAVMRPDWLRGGQQLVVAYDNASLRTELNYGPETIWSGVWDTQITAGGTQLQPQSEWDEVCWHTDDDVDYLELEMQLGGDWCLQRQFIMAREDRFLFLADALVGAAETEIEYISRLPLASEIQFQREEETREATLIGRRPLARVLPLSLPEWRTLSGSGVLELTPGGLCHRRTAHARRLYAPLFVDLERKRARQPLTWRRLTVAEKLRIVDEDVAVAYRVQVGDQQWLFYRSLDAPGSRTFLGQHLHDEFFAGRFDRDGETEELISVNTND